MAVTKRTRYEVLSRDGFTCRYCKATDVPLTIDHVLPVALGGSDKPDNLAAACRDCNAGKSSVAPGSATVAEVTDDDLRWAEAIRRAAVIAYDERPSIKHDWFLQSWQRWDRDLTYLPSDWGHSLDCWVDGGLPPEVIEDALDIALGNRGVTHRNVFAYMGGVARKKLEKLVADARQIIDEGGLDADGA